MKLVRISAGDDGESHLETSDQGVFEFVGDDGTRTALQETFGVDFTLREAGPVSEFHNAPRRQYVVYLTATIEIVCGDGSSAVVEPGDVLLAEDTTGHGHTFQVLRGGIGMTVRLED